MNSPILSPLENGVRQWEERAAISLGSVLLASHRLELSAGSRRTKAVMFDARYVVEAFDCASAAVIALGEPGRNLADAIEELRNSVADIDANGGHL